MNSSDASALWKKVMSDEKSKLLLSILGMLLFQQTAAFLSQMLFVDSTYGDEKHTFPPYSDFLSFVNALGAILLALVFFMVNRKPVCPSGPITAYAVIACCATVAVVSESQMFERFSSGAASSWMAWVVPAVMVLQWKVLRIQFDSKSWILCGLFSICTVFASSPWVGIPPFVEAEKNGARPHGFFWGASMSAFFVALYVGGESSRQIFQEKLFRDFNTTVSDQLLFIYVFVAAINLIGWLVGKHLSVIAGFVVDHPIIIVSLAATALPVAAKLYLMSYMLQLCGALVCVMVHEVVMSLSMAFFTGFVMTTESMSRWIGTVVMIAILLYFIIYMPGHSPRGSTIKEREDDIEEEVSLIREISIGSPSPKEIEKL